jgi:valyl-tRNA synthetase
MMVCTWGDVEDVEKWKEDKLETRLIIEKNGKLNEKAGKYAGLRLDAARDTIIKDLGGLKLLKNKTEITHTLNIHERCKHTVDFFVSPQWYVKILDLKDEIKKRGAELEWHPKFMKVHLDNWIDGLKWDWCISRDRFFGVPFPLWICEECGEIILPEDDELPVDPRENLPRNKSCPKCQSKNIKGETQVMDTWMTSSTTPLINAYWKEKDNLMEKVYPMSLRVQAFEIIRTWLFYTLAKSHLHTESLPWRNVMISGWGLAKNGEKMSKSLNNYVTAESMIQKYSADALRFWSCGATLGMNLRFSEEDIRAGQKLLTKIWNAARFAMINLEEYDKTTELNKKDLERADQWILSELQELIREVTRQFENYEFAKAKNALEHFFWIKFTDNYIELIKGRLYGKDKKKKLSAQFTLYSILSILIKLFAPILPHITEELFRQFSQNSNNPSSIHISHWPEINKELADKKMAESGKIILEIISEIRKLKSEKGIKLYEKIKKLKISVKLQNKAFIEGFSDDLKNISGAEKIELSENETELVKIIK